MPRYSKTLIILHWGMALLILAAWLTGEGGRQVRLNPLETFEYARVWWGPWLNLFGNIALFAPVGFIANRGSVARACCGRTPARGRSTTRQTSRRRSTTTTRARSAARTT